MGHGPAVAGVQLLADGTVVNWFNRRGGVPTVTHTIGSGSYTVGGLPRLDVQHRLNVIPLATLVSSPGEIGVGTSPGGVVVETFTSAGVAADVDLALVVFDSSTTGLTVSAAGTSRRSIEGGRLCSGVRDVGSQAAAADGRRCTIMCGVASGPSCESTLCGATVWGVRVELSLGYVVPAPVALPPASSAYAAHKQWRYQQWQPEP